MFPSKYTADSDDVRTGSNINIALFGDRILDDQTLQEYLIEFLQVFTSPKNKDNDRMSGQMSFHTFEQAREGNLRYYVTLRVALRRFIFYGRSKQESRSYMDTMAYEELERLMREHTLNGEEDIDLIHDLLLNYAIVTRNRGWYAQALLPVAEELILADLQGIKQRQKIKEGDNIDPGDIDGLFVWSKHNYLARGGQVLYLNLLQGLMKGGDAAQRNKEMLEQLLRNMLDCSGAGIGMLAAYVEREWEDKQKDAFGDEDEYKKIYDPKRFNMSFIADDFELRSERFVEEVITFLSANIHPITRIELFSQGLVVSLLRAMHLITDKKIGKTHGEPAWIMDMSQMGGTSNIAKLSAQSYASAYETFQSALLRVYDDMGGKTSGRFQAVQKAKKDSADVFKRLGKELKLIIPPRGAHERFSLSEPLVRYFVLALVKPGGKMVYDTFL